VSDLHARLLAATSPLTVAEERTPEELAAVIRAVVELHAPFQRSMLTAACRACSTPVHTQPGRYVTVTNWPCSTIQAIARELGVDGGS
jgi:hypothetical protein